MFAPPLKVKTWQSHFSSQMSCTLQANKWQESGSCFRLSWRSDFCMWINRELSGWWNAGIFVCLRLVVTSICAVFLIGQGFAVIWGFGSSNRIIDHSIFLPVRGWAQYILRGSRWFIHYRFWWFGSFMKSLTLSRPQTSILTGSCYGPFWGQMWSSSTVRITKPNRKYCPMCGRRRKMNPIQWFSQNFSHQSLRFTGKIWWLWCFWPILCTSS